MSHTSDTTTTNPLGLAGIDFITFASPEPEKLHRLFLAFGFSRTMRHESKAVDLYEQGDMVFLLDQEPTSASAAFTKAHGPTVSSMGWRFESPRQAFELALARGATAHAHPDFAVDGAAMPTIEGIGGMALHFAENRWDLRRFERMGFVNLETPDRVAPKGFFRVDHLTNNVMNGQMKATAAFYETIFGFTQVRYFDIRGVHTGLQSFALRSPCGNFCIPINEAKEATSQINEYLREHKGPGVQHIALQTLDILSSLEKLEGAPVQFLDIERDYYTSVFDRVKGVKESREEIAKRHVLVDGDDEGYLLQIFTQNLLGPIFFELIQRENHHAFGEGNFGALFRSIERDQAKRGVFRDAKNG
jgi:4-hydroxyphenylpyruvate dioxygenase